MNNPGTTVYVHWYGGKLLQGTVVNDHDLMGMVAVSIPVQGVQAIALFTPAHVYNQPPQSEVEPQQQAVSVPASSTKSNPSEAWQAVQKFKHEHWDQERNHLRIDALEEFYQLWRAGVAAKYGVTIEAAATVSADPGSPEGDQLRNNGHRHRIRRDVQYAALPAQPQPIVSEERYQHLKEKMKAKLTKKQLRSTGRIEYTDSIQTSFFD